MKTITTQQTHMVPLKYLLSSKILIKQSQLYFYVNHVILIFFTTTVDSQNQCYIGFFNPLYTPDPQNSSVFFSEYCPSIPSCNCLFTGDDYQACITNDDSDATSNDKISNFISYPFYYNPDSKKYEKMTKASGVQFVFNKAGKCYDDADPGFLDEFETKISRLNSLKSSLGYILQSLIMFKVGNCMDAYTNSICNYNNLNWPLFTN